MWVINNVLVWVINNVLVWVINNVLGHLRYYLSPTYNAILSSLPRQLNNQSHLGSPSLSNPIERKFDQ